MSEAVPILIAPWPAPAVLTNAVEAAGGRVAGPGKRPHGMVWIGDDPGGLPPLLDQLPSVRWVQLPAAGVEPYLSLMRDGRAWSCARDVYGPAVAEHALMLALMCMKQATASVRVAQWCPRPTVRLTEQEVVIIGGGAVCRALLALLLPFKARVTVLRRSGAALGAGVRVRGPEALGEIVPQARVLFLAAPLTPATRNLVDGRVLRSMRREACLVNVGRGELVVTDDLVTALRDGSIAAAALDVTEPEPLPPNHPLWVEPRCIITAHSAADLRGVLPEFATLVADNVRRLRSGKPPHGLVDPSRGY